MATRQFSSRLPWALLIVAAPALPQSATVGEALTSGETKLSLRARYEQVDQSGFGEDAQAFTLRGRLGYRSGKYQGFSLFTEFDTVQTIGAEDYNSGAGTSGPNRSQFPVIADPDYTEVNQAYLQYDGWSDTTLRLGRQRINFDNQRFVGGVGWRQNEQTYDAFSLTNSALAGVKISYAYIDNVNRIFGGEVPAGDHESSTHLLNLSREFSGYGSLTGYYYGIDNDDAAAFSTDTIGLRFNGKTDTLGPKLSYTLEYASQRDAANNPVNYDADYWRIDAAVAFSPATVSAGYEVLTGDASRSGAALRTPLATLHAFNGWADQFLTTPGAGLEDLFIGAKGKLDRFSWQAIWHDFSAEDGGSDYGQEIDLSIATKFGKHYSALLKYADFNADSPAFRDTSKFWLMFTAGF